MLEIIGSVLKRELKVIEHLYKNKGLHSLEDLKKLTGVTDKTIRADIKRINKNFPLLHIERELKTQVKIKITDNVGLEYVYRRLMELSVEFDFFEHLLIEPNYPIGFYVEKLFISPSYIRQLSRKWNKSFERKGMNISISTAQTMKIAGDEVLIRQAYTQYLLEKYGGDFQRRFKKIDSAWELIGYISEVLLIDMSYFNQLKLSYWVFVSTQRMKEGYYIKRRTDRYGKEEIAKLLHNKICDNVKFTEKFMYDYQVELSVEVLMDSLEVFDYDLHILGGLTKEITSYENKETVLTKEALKKFLLSLYDSLHYENAFSDQILVGIYNSMIFQFQITYFCYNYYGEFREYVKKENPLFLKMFEVHLKKSELPNYLKENDGPKNQLLYYVVIHSKLLLEMLPKLVGQKKLLILTTFHNSYEDLLKEKIKNRFAGNVSISRYHSNQLQFDIKYMKQFDLILTNYDHTPKELENRILYLDTSASMELVEKIEEKLKGK